MHKRIFYICIIAFYTGACGRPGELPRALENKKSSIEIVAKRGYEDLIESLYAELSDKDETLQQFHRDIRQLSALAKDSAEAFVHFNSRNEAYYSSATAHIGSLADTALKKQIGDLFSAHRGRYDSLVSVHRLLRDSVEQRGSMLADLQVLMKLYTTLPLIEQYQQNHLPDTGSLHHILHRQEDLIRLADSMVQSRHLLLPKE